MDLLYSDIWLVICTNTSLYIVIVLFTNEY